MNAVNMEESGILESLIAMTQSDGEFVVWMQIVKAGFLQAFSWSVFMQPGTKR